MTNRMVKLARRPVGLATRDDFLIEDQPVPEPGEVNSAFVTHSFRSIPPCAAG